MVTLYVRGEQVGDLGTLPGLMAQRAEVEFRDAAGRRLGTFTPAPEPICPWEPDLTREELDRRCAQTGVPLSAIFQRLGIE